MNSETAVAVVGVGCRFPEAATPEEFWSNLDKGVVSLRDIPAEDLRRCGVSPEAAAAPGFVTRSGWIEDPELFAAEFFGCTPRRGRADRPAAAPLPGGLPGRSGAGRPPAER
ncbi:beta-ketoacyl synthase N-terminal-like domain-containing protein [Streptomyces monomycini]|uniref:beta-ketoacyl synthase N-terminal-like domain-containing protein n=1 Tax=Streptomyces monomycini TaxID=371720 RepID=UPI00067DE513|nr:beta-ketoacyl synthase N-terminal-like domain-containing protein [Streptomyces monomycini]